MEKSGDELERVKGDRPRLSRLAMASVTTAGLIPAWVVLIGWVRGMVERDPGTPQWVRASVAWAGVTPIVGAVVLGIGGVMAVRRSRGRLRGEGWADVAIIAALAAGIAWANWANVPGFTS